MSELFPSVLLIKCEVQLQNIDSGITEDAKITPLGVLLNEFADFVFAQRPSFSDARDLKLGITQADLWIEAAPGRSYCVRGDSVGVRQSVFLSIVGDAIFDCVLQLLRSRSQIAAAGIGGVIAVARGRRSRMKILRIRKGLT